jgi:hypothetical protein
MAGALRLFSDVSYALALMACAGIVSGFATAGLTGNSVRSLQMAIAMFAVTGALLTVRLWRTTRGLGLPPADRVSRG